MPVPRRGFVLALVLVLATPSHNAFHIQLFRLRGRERRRGRLEQTGNSRSLFNPKSQITNPKSKDPHHATRNPQPNTRRQRTEVRCQIERRTSNIEHRILMTLRFIYLKTSESQNTEPESATSYPRRARGLSLSMAAESNFEG
jgi:hypothetical protein